jgi:hypothetical protein
MSHAHKPASSRIASRGESPAATWRLFWFTPADAQPLALVRILTGLLGLALAGSFVADLEIWFGPDGMLTADAMPANRPGGGLSVFWLVSSTAAIQTVFGILIAAFLAMTFGLATRFSCVVAAILWASLLNRGPMLAGPADDCLAVLLWCLAVGPSGADWSIDRLLRDRRGLPPPAASPWARVSLGLLRVHAVAMTVAMLLAELKGDAWWDGTAAWWLATRPDSRLFDLTGIFRGSEYLMNLVTHGIVAFEVVFAGGLWFLATRQHVARSGLVAWPLIGMLAGEPAWGLAMAIFCVPDALPSK